MECDGFEWDDDKAEENPLNHDGVTFEEATAVFADDDTVELFDEIHSEEEGRYYALGFYWSRSSLGAKHSDHFGSAGERTMGRIL